MEYLQSCLRDGLSVIGASSLDYDVAREKYPSWLFLPYITQPDFDEALKQAISDFGIRNSESGGYSPNLVVWGYLSRKLKDIAPGVALVNESPVGAELSGYWTARAWARSRLDPPFPIASSLTPKAHLSEIELVVFEMILHPYSANTSIICACHRRTGQGITANTVVPLHIILNNELLRPC